MSERSIFLAALEIPDPAERAAFLERACEGDPAARRGVEGLLAAHDRPGSFLDGPADDGPTRGYEEAEGRDDPTEGAGGRVGPYKLLQRIGEGGMGVVYMAEQQEPVRRTVALKLIRHGADSKSVLARFEAERQALALMDHPNIARVLDVGATGRGTPYFVMELVKGVPITRFCDENRLGLRERLALFVPVCQAIQHAHQKGVIHRDIKPSNVLVALYDDRPVPKVIDFGVAKATSQKLTDRTLFTAFGSVVGTLEYMSPEQAKLNQLDIDTRSDVYALGVLLYELLTGTTPIDRARLKAAALDEVLRLIREEEPVRPSTRLSTAQTRPEVAAARKIEPDRLGRALRGELDWIVMKALEKDRARRYETANGLVRDVQRYLEDEPVEACPPTLGYRLQKAYRRNRAAVGVASSFVLLLVASAVLATGLAIQARQAERAAAFERDRARAQQAEAVEQRRAADRERRRAEEEKRSAQAVRDFLQTDLLGQASDYGQAEARRQGGASYTVQTNPTVGELLDRADAQLAPGRIDAKFPDLPFVQAEALKTVGNSYLAINRVDKGLELLRRAVDLYDTSRGPDDPAALDARHLVAVALDRLGRFDDAQAAYDAVVRDKSRVLGPHHPETITSQILQGSLFLSKGRPAEALEHFRRLGESARAHLGPDHYLTTWAVADHAIALRYSGRKDEAIRAMEPLVAEALRRKIPLDHPAFEAGTLELAEMYKDAGRRDEANALLRKALADVEAALGPRHPATWYFRNGIAHEHLRVKEIDAAIALFELNLGLDVRPGRKMSAHEGLAQCHAAAGRFDDALAQYRQILDLLLKTHGADHRSWWAGKVRARIGQALLAKKDYAAAEPMLLAGYRDLVDHPGQQTPWDSGLKAEVGDGIRALYRAMDRPDALAKWEREGLKVLAADFEKLARSAPKLTSEALQAAGNLALAYGNAGRDDEAIRLFEQVMARLKDEGWPLDEASQAQCDRLRLAVSRAGRHDLAAEMSAAIVAGLRGLPDAPRDQLARQVAGLGHHLLWGDHPAEAEGPLRESLAAHLGLDRGGWDATKAKLWLANALVGQKKYAEAEPLLLSTYTEVVERLGRAPAWEQHFPGMAADRLIELYTATDKPAEAESWQAERAKWGRGR